MTAAGAVLWWVLASPAHAEGDGCAPGLYPCEVGEAAAEDDLGTVADTGTPDGEPIEADADIEADIEADAAAGRSRYWYEPVTDVFWWPGEALAWVGLLGADHIDAAALTAWIAAVAAGAHRLWLWLWAMVAAPVAMVRRRLGLAEKPAAPARERLEGVSEADREYLEALVKRESETYLAALKTQVSIEHQKYLDQCRRTEAAVATLERVLGVSASAAGADIEAGE